MSTEKFLPLIVIFSIAVMLSFSMLPAMATHLSDTPVGVCPGGPNGNSPWVMRTLPAGTEGLGADVNANGHTCFNEHSGIEKDDRIPNKL